MKKLLSIIILGILFILTGCDNNDGPFQIKNENGRKILYSGKKPAKGWVEYTVYNRDNTTTTIYEIDFKDGKPSGDFTLYSLNGKKIFEGKGKWKDEMFVGEILLTYTGGEKLYGEGKFTFDRTSLLNYPDYVSKGINYSYVIKGIAQSLYDGEINDDGSITIMKDGKLVKEEIKYNNGYKAIVKYDNEGIMIDKTVYDEQGKLFMKNYQEKEFWHEVEYDEKEQVKYHTVYKGTSKSHSYHHTIK